MKMLRKIKMRVFVAGAVIGFLLLSGGSAFAHCDTLDGPVVMDARAALAKEDVFPVLKWVSNKDEDAIKKAFKNTVTVRKLGEDARDLADMYFFETLVRIHRAGEGAPYSGLKSGDSVDPAVVLADEAIAWKSVEKLTNILGNALKGKLTKQYNAVISSKEYADDSIEEGRVYVQAYVEFTHFAEGVHGLIKGGAHHREHN